MSILRLMMKAALGTVEEQVQNVLSAVGFPNEVATPPPARPMEEPIPPSRPEEVVDAVFDEAAAKPPTPVNISPEPAPPPTAPPSEPAPPAPPSEPAPTAPPSEPAPTPAAPPSEPAPPNGAPPSEPAAS